MNNSLLYAAIAVAVGSLVYAFNLMMRLRGQKLIISEAAAQSERGQRKLGKLEAKLSHLESELQASRSKVSSLEKSLLAADTKLKTRGQELESLESKLESLAKSESRSQEHLNEQISALTSQLAEAVKEKKKAMLEAEARSASAIPKDQFQSLQQSLERNKQTIVSLKKQNSSWKREVDKAREILRKVKPDEVKRFKVKSSRMEQLYSSMKGLREMAEERNANWERALRLMAAHINQRSASSDVATGPFVGKALEKIGANLVIDEYSDGTPPLGQNLNIDTPAAATDCL